MGSAAGRYRTSDLYYAAYLRVAGVPYLGLEVEPGTRKGYFIFDETVTPLGELKAQYFRDEARVPALSYGQAIRFLKKELADRIR